MIDISMWPSSNVTTWPLDRLIPYARNARTHSAAQVAQIAASIREWGWTMPIFADEDGGIIAGHGRVLAARQLGLTDVPVMTAKGWTEAQKRAYVLADNKLALNADWDPELLRTELVDLQSMGADLGLIGFSDDEIRILTADKNEGLTDTDEVPGVPEDPVNALGDVWHLGRHRLVCGDSTDPLVVEKALGGVKPHLMVTDPPYGVEYDAAWRNDAMQAGKDSGAPGGRTTGKVENDTKADWREGWALFPGDVAYVWCASLHLHEAAESLVACGFTLRASIIWAKSNFAMAGVTTIGSMNHAGTPFGRGARATGQAIGSNPRYGRSLRPRNRRPGIRPRSRSSA